VKIKRIISSLLAVVLTAAILVGSTGFTVIYKSCHSAGLSVSTSIINSADTCCGTETPATTPDRSESMGNVCCTFDSEKIILPSFVKSDTGISIFVADILPLENIFYVPVLQEQSISPVFVFHNKHGGRFIQTTNCQFLI